MGYTKAAVAKQEMQHKIQDSSRTFTCKKTQNKNQENAKVEIQTPLHFDGKNVLEKEMCHARRSGCVCSKATRWAFIQYFANQKYQVGNANKGTCKGDPRRVPMTHAEALAELIAEVDQFMDPYGAGCQNIDTSRLESALANAKTSLRYHRPHEHAFDRTNNERKDNL